MRATGLILIGLLLIVPAVQFAAVANGRDAIAVFSQYLGASALIAMAISQVIATRLPGVEPVFGPLDRGYVLHKWLGIGALAAILLHDTIDAEIRALGPETVLSEIGETLGEISLYGFLILIVITIATFIPYHLWKWTHRLMGAFFTASALHFLLIRKPFDLSDLVGIYVSAACAIGVLAYGYTLLPETARASRRYTVAQRHETGDAVSLTLDPVGRPLKHRPGQFAVFRFDAPGLTEPHPFTISTAGGEGQLRLTFRALGDFTTRAARQIKPGDGVQLQGPFGRFLRHTGPGPQLWIAGGIGVTPFVAWAEALGDDAADIHMFYCLRDRDTAPHLGELRAVAGRLKGFHLHEIVSAEGGRLTASRMAELSGADMTAARAWFCGPAAMRKALQADLGRLGLSARRFHYEEFEFRTGIGLRRLSDWLWQRSARKRIAG